MGGFITGKRKLRQQAIITDQTLHHAVDEIDNPMGARFTIRTALRRWMDDRKVEVGA
jgi:hypothetical protein